MNDKKRDKLMYMYVNIFLLSYIHALLYNANYNELQLSSNSLSVYSDSSVEYYEPPNPAAGYSYNQLPVPVYAVPISANQTASTSQPTPANKEINILKKLYRKRLK